MSATAQFVQFNSLFIQNFWTDTRFLDGAAYTFVPFIFQGASQELGGENSEAFLAFSNTSLSLAILNRSAINQPITIKSRWLTTSLEINTAFTRDEVFLINSVAWNEERVEVRLRSPVDAATARFPNRRLTSGLVGNLPREGSVRVA